MTIPFDELKSLAEKYGLSHIVMLAHQAGPEVDHVVTYGVSLVQSEQAAEFGNRLKAGLGWPESLSAVPDRVTEALERAELIEKLRAEEGACVTINCDNPDPDERRLQSSIDVIGEWTAWQERRFTGRTVLEALRAAAAAKSPARKCEICGCVEERACEGGCAWDGLYLGVVRYVCTTAKCVNTAGRRDAALAKKNGRPYTGPASVADLRAAAPVAA